MWGSRLKEGAKSPWAKGKGGKEDNFSVYGAKGNFATITLKPGKNLEAVGRNTGGISNFGNRKTMG